MVYDSNAKKWSTAYPFIESPTVLKNNYSQALACLRSLETQLRKKERLSEFNIAFQDIVDRGVFRELTPHEVSSYSGPVNYISFHSSCLQDRAPLHYTVAYLYELFHETVGSG